MEALNQKLAGLGRLGSSNAADAMAAIYDSLSRVDEVQLQMLEAFDEQALQKLARTRARQINGNGLSVDGRRRTPLEEAFVLLRAVELIALETCRATEGDAPGDLEDAYRTSDGGHFVIPNIRATGALTGRPFLRRALLNHRVLPTHAGGLDVRLYRLPGHAHGRFRENDLLGTERVYGAALIPGFNLEIATTSSTFTAKSVSGFDAETVFDAQLTEARRSGCRAVVWAELTMPDDAVATIGQKLRSQALAEEAHLDFALAGSWHRPVGSKLRNVATVFDGAGYPLFDLTKWARFKIGEKIEDIEPGSEIPVLITEDRLAVLAICKDFLTKASAEPPYACLNVDLAFVPSMATGSGVEATMKGHAAAADTMRVRFGTRTLVVLQPATANAGVVGHIMAFPVRPLLEEAMNAREPLVACTVAER